MVLLRLLSTDYAVTTAAGEDSTCPDSDFTEAVKVGFVDGTPHQLAVTPNVKVTGRESRVPLQYHEMCELLQVLKERGSLLGSSTFKGHRSAFLIRK